MVKYEGLPLKQIPALLEIAKGGSQKAAAERTGVTEQTMSNWANRPEFKAAVHKLRHQMIQEGQDKVRGLLFTAIDTVSKSMKEAKGERVRLDAAKYILDTIRLAPMKEAGLWLVGPKTSEGVLREEIESGAAEMGIIEEDDFI